jgi:hypothetical protein
MDLDRRQAAVGVGQDVALASVDALSGVVAFDSGGFCEALRDVGGERDAGRRLIEAGLNEAAVGLVLWAEYLARTAAVLIAGGGAMLPGAQCCTHPAFTRAASDAGRACKVVGRAVSGG